MTLYTSVIDPQRKRTAKTAYIYLSAALFCALFGGIYELFSHEVYSFYMIYAFAIPLAMGVLPYLLMSFTNIHTPSRLAANLYGSGVAALTVGSIFKGVLDIYGTSSDLTIIYLAAGIALTLAGIIAYFIGGAAKKKAVPMQYGTGLSSGR